MISLSIFVWIFLFFAGITVVHGGYTDVTVVYGGYMIETSCDYSTTNYYNCGDAYTSLSASPVDTCLLLANAPDAVSTSISSSGNTVDKYYLLRYVVQTYNDQNLGVTYSSNVFAYATYPTSSCTPTGQECWIIGGGCGGLGANYPQKYWRFYAATLTLTNLVFSDWFLTQKGTMGYCMTTYYNNPTTCSNTVAKYTYTLCDNVGAVCKDITNPCVSGSTASQQLCVMGPSASPSPMPVIPVKPSPIPVSFPIASQSPTIITTSAPQITSLPTSAPITWMPTSATVKPSPIPTSFPITSQSPTTAQTLAPPPTQQQCPFAPSDTSSRRLTSATTTSTISLVNIPVSITFRLKKGTNLLTFINTTFAANNPNNPWLALDKDVLPAAQQLAVGHRRLDGCEAFVEKCRNKGIALASNAATAGLVVGLLSLNPVAAAIPAAVSVVAIAASLACVTLVSQYICPAISNIKAGLNEILGGNSKRKLLASTSSATLLVDMNYTLSFNYQVLTSVSSATATSTLSTIMTKPATMLPTFYNAIVASTGAKPMNYTVKPITAVIIPNTPSTAPTTTIPTITPTSQYKSNGAACCSWRNFPYYVCVISLFISIMNLF